jgi:2-isopropylmalate synthase
VGRSAFAHKGGIHVAAVRRNVDSYQHITPELVGNEMRVLVSDLSGRGNILSVAEQYQMEDSDRISRDVLEEIKQLESQGFVFESAEASVAVRLKRAQADYTPPFELIDFMVVVEQRHGRGIVTEATVKLRVRGEIMHTAAEGNGPVNALDLALRKALLAVYPQLADLRLVDYKVRILDGEAATGATTRVIIDSVHGDHEWSTVGANTNIIVASWYALADSMEYVLSLTT